MEKMIINPWHYKPWWCQPWSIFLTGSLLIVGSWTAIANVWLSITIAMPVLIWMVYFLLIWPRLVRDLLRAELSKPDPNDNIDAEPVES